MLQISPEIITGSPDTGEANVIIASSDNLSEIDIDPTRLFFNIFQAKVDTEPQFSPAMVVVSSFLTETRFPVFIDSN